MKGRPIPFLFLTLRLFGQIEFGPVCGGMTDSSANLFVSGITGDTITLLLFSDTLYQTMIGSYYGVPDSQYGWSYQFHLTSLVPGQWYGYTVIQNGDSVFGYFRTFPDTLAYPFRVAFGSCIGNTDSLFRVIDRHRPDLLVVIGDWGYYDNPIDSASDTNFYSDEWGNILMAYYRRYYGDFPYLRDFLRRYPVAYIWDDHDFTGDGSCAYSATYYDTNGVKLDTVPYNDSTVYHVRLGYDHLFPHYPYVDSADGIYQKVEVPGGALYLLDMRTRKSAFARAFQKVGGVWSFIPPDSHSTLGIKQRQWLVQELISQSGCWKVVFSPVVFNVKLRQYMLKLLSLQSLNPLFGLAGMAMGEFWIGYPFDQDTLISLVQNGLVKGVIVGSGDVHTAAMDDGTNSGIPEVVAGALGQRNSKLAYYMSLLGENPEAYYNRGAQAYGPLANDTLPAFGLFELYGCDSLRALLINAQGDTIAMMTLLEKVAGLDYFDTENLREPCFQLTRYSSTIAFIRVFNLLGEEIVMKERMEPGIYVVYKYDSQGNLVEICKVGVLGGD